MNLKESIKIVQMLHTAYPQDRKATAAELSQRAQSYQVAFADYEYSVVERAAQFCIMSNKWYPTTRELLDAAARARLTASVTPITTAKPVDDAEMEKYLDAFCLWLGFGNDPDGEEEGGLPYEK